MRAEIESPVGFRIVGRSGPGVPWEGRTIRFARRPDGQAALGDPYVPGDAGARIWPLHPEWANGQYDILEPELPPPGEHVVHLTVDTTTPTSPERCYMPTENPDGTWTTKSPAPEPSTPPAGVPVCKVGCGVEVITASPADRPCKQWLGEVCYRGVPGKDQDRCFCTNACRAAGRPLNPPPSDHVTVATRERPSHCQCPYHNCAGKLENPDHELCELCYRRRGDECVTVATGGVPGGYRLGDGWLTTGIGMCRGGRHKDPDVRHEGTFVHDDGRGYCLEHAFQAGALVPIDTARSVPPGPLPPEGEPVLFTCQHGLTRSEPGCGAMCNLKPGSLWTGPHSDASDVSVKVDPTVTASDVRAAVAAQAARVAAFSGKPPGPVPVEALREDEARRRDLEPVDASQSNPTSNPTDNLYPMEGPELYSNIDACRGCGGPLLPENRRIADGCPCNSRRGVNHGLVPKNTCTCVECDAAQTGSTRYPPLPAWPCAAPGINRADWPGVFGAPVASPAAPASEPAVRPLLWVRMGQYRPGGAPPSSYKAFCDEVWTLEVEKVPRLEAELAEAKRLQDCRYAEAREAEKERDKLGTEVEQLRGKLAETEKEAASWRKRADAKAIDAVADRAINEQVRQAVEMTERQATARVRRMREACDARVLGFGREVRRRCHEAVGNVCDPCSICADSGECSRCQGLARAEAAILGIDMTVADEETERLPLDTGTATVTDRDDIKRPGGRTVAELIAASSLVAGVPVEIRNAATPDDIDRILARVAEMEREDAEIGRSLAPEPGPSAPQEQPAATLARYRRWIRRLTDQILATNIVLAATRDRLHEEQQGSHRYNLAMEAAQADAIKAAVDKERKRCLAPLREWAKGTEDSDKHYTSSCAKCETHVPFGDGVCRACALDLVKAVKELLASGEDAPGAVGK